MVSILYFICYRLILALLIQNYDYPDEYWQAPEIAHSIFFGYGYKTWEWTIQQPIRNPLYPSILSIGYFFKYLAPSQYQDYFVEFGPKLIQALMGSFGDFFLLKILKFYYGQVSFPSIFVIFCNWFYAGMLSRMYGNSFQTVLTIIAFYFWITRKNSYKNDFISRLVVIVAYVSRPTSILLWTLIWPYELFTDHTPFFSYKFLKFILKNITNIFLMVLSSFCVGSIYFKKPILTEVNFFKCNFIDKWSHLYGVNSSLFYFTVSLPLMLGIGYLFLLISIAYIWTNQKQEKQLVKRNELKKLSILCFAYLLISSASVHKEHRFILSILPFLLLLSVYCFRKFGSILKVFLFFYVFCNLFLFNSINVLGKQGGFEAMRQLRRKISPQQAQNTKVIFMGQSHFIPAMSVLHRNVSLNIPDSSPMKMAIEKSQNDLLYKDPQFLYKKLDEKQEAKYILGQGMYYKNYKHLLQGSYRKVGRWRNRNIFEEYIFGQDWVILFERK